MAKANLPYPTGCLKSVADILDLIAEAKAENKVIPLYKAYGLGYRANVSSETLDIHPDSNIKKCTVQSEGIAGASILGRGDFGTGLGDVDFEFLTSWNLEVGAYSNENYLFTNKALAEEYVAKCRENKLSIERTQRLDEFCDEIDEMIDQMIFDNYDSYDNHDLDD